MKLDHFTGGNIKQREHLNKLVDAVNAMEKKEDEMPLRQEYAIDDGDLVKIEFRANRVEGPLN